MIYEHDIYLRLHDIHNVCYEDTTLAQKSMQTVINELSDAVTTACLG